MSNDNLNASTLIVESEAELERALDELSRILPLPIAQCLGVGGIRRDIPTLLFSAESALRFLAAVVKAIYLAGPIRPSQEVNDLIRRFLIWPSTGSWWNFLRGCLPLFRSGALTGGFPGIVTILEALPAQDVNRIIELRNAAHGHVGAPLAPELEQVVRAELLPLVASVLQTLAPLAAWPLVVYDARLGIWLRCMGPAPTPETRDLGVNAPYPAVLLDTPLGDLPLFPLVVGTFDGYVPAFDLGKTETVLVYDGVDVDRSRIVYVGRHGRGHGKRWFEDYRRRLQERSVALVPCQAQELPGGELLDRLRTCFLQTVDLLRAQGDFDGGAQRLDPAAVGALNDSVASPARIAILAGEAGMGKSTHLVALGQRVLAGGGAVIHLDARMVLSDPTRAFRSSLRVALEGQLALLGASEALLNLAQAAVKAERGDAGRVVLLIDGIDEVGSPARGSGVLSELADWLRRNADALPQLRVVLAVRGTYLAATQRSSKPLAPIADRLYRPTRRGARGADAVEDAIYLLPLDPDSDEVDARYEAYRAGVPSRRPLTPFNQLSPAVRDACRNPRWMVQLLSEYHAREVPALGGAAELWEVLVRREVFALVGGRPLYPGRVRLLDALAAAQLDQGRLFVPLHTLEADPQTGPLVLRDSPREELMALQSVGLLSVEGSDPHDPFGPLVVGPASEGMAVALLANAHPFRTGVPEGWVTRVEAQASTPLWSCVSDAALQVLSVRATRDGFGAVRSAAERLDVGLQARLLLRVLADAKAARGVLPLPGLDEAERELLATLLLATAWGAGQQKVLLPLAEQLLQLPMEEQSAATVEMVARILRHSERVPEAESWLETVIAARPDLECSAGFQRAELLRDKGRWRSARRAYAGIVGMPVDVSVRALALAALGECEIWTGQKVEALEHLADALELIGEADAPTVKCNIHIKRGIAARLARRYPLAVSALLAAEAIALRLNYRTELAKIELELGLVACAVDRFDEALQHVDSALERHRAQGFVKGVKKAMYCRGHVLQRAGRPGAFEAFHESLALNQKHFDLLGLQLNHRALAELLRTSDPAAATEHAQKAFEFGNRLDREESPHERDLL
ncbi:MAG: AAA family ATPase [Myxococcota bacterium]